MYAKEVVTSLLLAQKPVKQIAKIVGCHLATVYRIQRSLLDGPRPRKPGSGRPRSARTPKVIRSVRDKVRRNPIRSIRKLAKEAGISKTTMQRLVKDDLKCSSRARVKRHLVTDRIKQLRLERSKRLVSSLKKKHTIIVFSDEKMFTIDPVSNTRTDRFISPKIIEDVPENVKFKFTTKHPAGVMVFGAVASNGLKMPPVFIKAGLKVNTDVYMNILKDHVLPWMKTNFGAHQHVIFQQDGAPCHTSKRTQAWLKENMEFWPKDIWPPSSPDLNPLDYSIWAYVQAKACERSHPSVGALKASITKAWNSMTVSYIEKVCSRFRPRLEKVIEKNGGHIE